MFKSGFISVIGHPNVGKSTLVNKLVGTKVAIISPKAQTTRNVIRGVYTDDNKQVVFLDTPGIHIPLNKLGNLMNNKAKGSIHDVEAIMLVVSCFESIDSYKEIIDSLNGIDIPVILIINKIDALDNSLLEATINKWKKVYDFSIVFPLSALNDNDFSSVLDYLENILPEGPMYYPKESKSDNNDAFIISELIREQILKLTSKEIPHSIAVLIERIEYKLDLEISATIICERDSQKGILIGKNGSMIKKIKTKSIKEIEDNLNMRTKLELFVRVEKDWRNRDIYLKEFGYKVNG